MRTSNDRWTSPVGMNSRGRCFLAAAFCPGVAMPVKRRGRPPRHVRLKGQALRRRAQNPPRHEPTHDALDDAVVKPEGQRDLARPPDRPRDIEAPPGPDGGD